MSKRKKEMLIASLALLALLAAFAVLVLTKDKEEETPSETQSEVDDTSVMLYEHEQTDITNIRIENEYGGYDIKGESSDSSESEDSMVWTIEEFDGLPVMSSSLGTTATNAAALTANSLVEENCTDLSKFGLDSPAAKAEISFVTGTTQTVYVGDETPLGSQYYVRMNGDKNVYTVAETFVSAYFNPKESYLNCLIIADIGDDELYPEISELSVTRKDLQKPIIVTPLSVTDRAITTNSEDTSVSSSFSDYKLVSPVKASIDFSKQGSLLFGMYGLSADHAVSAYPTEEQKNACGLNDPFCVVEMKLSEGGSSKLIVGNSFEADGITYYFAMLEGREIIYAFSEASLYWNTVEPMDFITRATVMPYIYNIADIKITAEDGTVYKFEQKDKLFYYNGNQLDDEKFKSFCQYLYKGIATGINYGEVEYNPSVTVKFSFTDTSIPDATVGYQRTDTRSIYVSQDGSVDFTAQAKYLDRLLENVDNVINGKDILLSW
ncbi:MAG: DUF4340 domain-containing protein [Oscillospiraceae bacterium]